jgi:hypothetical protein
MKKGASAHGAALFTDDLQREPAREAYQRFGSTKMGKGVLLFD